MKKKKRTDIRTYTKVLVKWILIVAVINGSLPFILSFLGRDPVTELGVVWVSSIVFTVISYCLKSYFETKQQKKQELEDFLAGKPEEYE